MPGYGAWMPVEFLSDAEAAAFGRFVGAPARDDLDRFFFLDDADLELIDDRRGSHNRLGFALHLGTVRFLGTFLPDPSDVPGVVLRDVAGQLQIEDFSCIGRYLQRTQTRFDHAEEIQIALGLREFPAVAGEFEEWVIARAWMTGDGPRAIFADAVGWLRQRGVLLPGVTTLARTVARARADGDMRLWETLGALPTGAQELVLESVLEVAGGSRVSDLERLRKGPAYPTGKNLKLALRRVAELHESGIDPEHVRALVPARRLVELARYGLVAKAARLRRHPPARRTATLLATVVHLQASSIDDCLELFDLLMMTELVGKASRETAKQRARQHPRLARASVKLAAAVKKLLEASSAGETIRVEDLWREIEQVVDRGELRAAVETVSELVPHVDQDDEGDARAKLSEGIRMVSVVLRELCETVELGANPEGESVLREMRRMRWLLDRRKLNASDINDGLVHGSWRRLVYGQPPNGDGTVDGNAYVFCVLASFTGICSAGTSTRPARPAGGIPARCCSAARRGRGRRTRCSPPWGGLSARMSTSPSSPQRWTAPIGMSPGGSEKTRS